MQSIVSYPDRGVYGRNTYRGNCSGLLIKDIIQQYKLQGLSDFMVGSGTTEDVVREAGIRGDFADLNRGYDMMSMDIPTRASVQKRFSPMTLAAALPGRISSKR